MRLGKTIISPCCGYPIDSATHLHDNDKRPKAGDISICLQCGTISQYNEDLSLRLLTPEEQFTIAMEHAEMWDDIVKLQVKIRSTRFRFK